MIDYKNEILVGDCIEVLKQLPNEVIDTCVTSPPYWNLRDYGKEKQLGKENTPKEYIDNLVAVFREVKRVLKDGGTLWLNMGDVYNGQSKKFGYKPKELMGLPWRVAFALQDDGWHLRSDIIWSKPNPLPESVRDRPTKSHEYIFLFTKKPKNYYYDFEAIAEETNATKTNKRIGKTNGKYGNQENESKHRQGLHGQRGEKLIEFRPLLPKQKEFVDFLRSKVTLKQLVENMDLPKSKMEHWFRYDEGGFSFPSVEDWNVVKWLIDDWSEEFNEFDTALTTVDYKTDEVKSIKEGYKNKRTVWKVATKPFKGGHFAPYPPDLIKPCILAGCPENGIVLDPFMGSGTTGLVAKENNRNFVGIELNPDFAEVSKNRIGLGAEI